VKSELLGPLLTNSRVALTLLFAWLQLQGHAAWANSCLVPQGFTESDMAPHVGPIKDQDSIGWCYAYSSADLLNQYLYLNRHQRHGTELNKTVSPISLALLYNQFDNSGFNCGNSLPSQSTPQGDGKKHHVEENGMTCNTIKIALQKSLCLEESMQSADYSYVSGINCVGSTRCQLDRLLDRLANTGLGQFTCTDLNSALALVPGALPRTVWDILQHSNRSDVLNRLRDLRCQFSMGPFNSSTPPPTPKSYSIDFSKILYNNSTNRYPLENHNSALFTEMDKRLKNGRVVSISYFPEFLQKTNPKHKKDASQKAGTTQEDNETHASTIVGRRFNPTTCEIEYKMKNSWGTGCKTYMTDPWLERGRCEAEWKERRYLNGLSSACQASLMDPLGEPTAECNTEAKKFTVTNEIRNQKLAECQTTFVPAMTNQKLKCEEPGYLFIPRSELAKNMFNISTLEY